MPTLDRCSLPFTTLVATLVMAMVLPQVVAAEDLQRQEIDGRVFWVAAGYTLEKVAAAPLTERPISAVFDDAGRLYVTEASGTNAPVKEQVVERPHRVVVLEDRDGDGKFDQRHEFADQLMLPEGVLYHRGDVYVTAPPEIWRLRDRDGDLKADEREAYLNPTTLTGCANDLHGPFIGRDRWIYWCKGAFAEQSWPQPGQPNWKTTASHVFRRHPITGAVEPVYTSGMDNPVEFSTTLDGERFVVGTFLLHPAGGKRDGMVHAIYGGVYGKPHQVLDSHPRTSPDLMPVMTHMGPAAPAAVTTFESTALFDQPESILACAQFNLQQVSLHRLQRLGATYSTQDQTLVRSEQIDFHPTDLIEDADGSLLLVDTGGWYRLCCPTSHLDQSAALGGIYRLRREGAPVVDDPRGLALSWDQLSREELARRLVDPRHEVRRQALEWLLVRKDADSSIVAEDLLLEMVGAERKNTSRPVALRAEALWGLISCGTAKAEEIVVKQIDHSEPLLRKVAMHGASLWRWQSAVPALTSRLSGPADEARVAAEALGRLGDVRVIPELFARAFATDDEILRHSLLYAVIELGNVEAVARQLGNATDDTQRATIAFVFDEMCRDANQRERVLPTEQILPWLAHQDPVIRRLASWIVRHRQSPGSRLVRWLDPLKEVPAELSIDEIASLANVNALDDEAQAVLVNWITKPQSGWQQSCAAAILRSTKVNEWPKACSAAVVKQLQITEGKELRATGLPWFAFDRAVKLEDAHLRAALIGWANDVRLVTSERLRAYWLVADDAVVAKAAVELATVELTSESEGNRQAAVRLLEALPAREIVAAPLLERLPEASPLELRTLLSVIARAANAESAKGLAVALRESPLVKVMPHAELTDLFKRSGPEIKSVIEAYQAEFSQSFAKQREALLTLERELPPGDRVHGLQVFRSAKAACSACHSIGYVGGKIGPDLSRIGGIRTRIDLLEAIIYPSQSFVRSYEPVSVLTTAGQVYSGIEVESSATEIVLQTTADTKQRILRADIDQIQPGTVSVMPAGLDRQLSKQELADLLELLSAAK